MWQLPEQRYVSVYEQENENEVRFEKNVDRNLVSSLKINLVSSAPKTEIYSMLFIYSKALNDKCFLYGTDFYVLFSKRLYLS